MPPETLDPLIWERYATEIVFFFGVVMISAGVLLDINLVGRLGLITAWLLTCAAAIWNRFERWVRANVKLQR